ncbi:methyltransferase [Haloarcula hispanica]|uniref:Methyltransferase domain-containing protein n=1 Tax=Haloarcula hispanica TaxID=51589 RepID=A0A482T8U9_HALHI|nr:MULTISPECIES: METTL5 family protein [Haloarcula]AJF26747.1 RNA methyltransferase [Haloarcula sp. CBA1115]KAA9407423.1 methyltransferase domain-containing protein [Haloarcula sp. CBA1131]MCJ0618502.1 methyltransferase [Haloarcula hispanica]RYJ09095.1 methyltransferase domain-containing protein [Haloarcula hispanica]
MPTKSALAQQLAVVAGFDNPRASLEQYRTPPDLAAHLVHTADLQDDIQGQTVVDLGCGTGMLALGAALRSPARVVGLDIDPAPLSTARENERKVGSTTPVSWVRADATTAPLCPPTEETTVVMNPPFGAQSDNEHADRRFLETAAVVAGVSYSIHNEGSQSFVESFAADNGGEVTHAFETEFDLPRQFEFHESDRQAITAEVYRIDWT